MAVRFLLHPSVEVRPDSLGLILKRTTGRARLIPGAGATAEVVSAEWWSDMGRAHQTKRIVVTGSGRVECLLTTDAAT